MGFGKGLNLGFRGGRGNRHNPHFYDYTPYSTLTKDEELKILKNQSDFYKKDLEEIQKRISELENEK